MIVDCDNVHRCLYGDLQASFAPGGGLVFGTGRSGRLHVTEPGGSMHGNHPYLGAVAVLRFVYPQDAWAAAMRQSQEAGNDNPLTIVREAQQLLGQQGEAAAEAVCLDVYGTVSETAVPLPVRSLPALMTHAGVLLARVNMGNWQDHPANSARAPRQVRHVALQRP